MTVTLLPSCESGVGRKLGLIATCPEPSPSRAGAEAGCSGAGFFF